MMESSSSGSKVQYMARKIEDGTFSQRHHPTTTSPVDGDKIGVSEATFRDFNENVASRERLDSPPVVPPRPRRRRPRQTDAPSSAALEADGGADVTGLGTLDPNIDGNAPTTSTQPTAAEAEAKVAHLEEQLDKAHYDAEDALNNHEACLEKMNHLRDEIKRLLEEKRRLQINLECSQETEKLNEDELNQARRQLKDTQEHAKALQEEVDRCRHEEKVLKRRLEQAETELDEARRQVREGRNREVEMQDQLNFTQHQEDQSSRRSQASQFGDPEIREGRTSPPAPQVIILEDANIYAQLQQAQAQLHRLQREVEQSRAHGHELDQELSRLKDRSRHRAQRRGSGTGKLGIWRDGKGA